MQAGKLDRKVELQRFASITDPDSGEQVKAWALLTYARASKVDVSDRERIASGELSAQIGARFQIRWSSIVEDLNPKDRLICADRTYEITAVKEIGRRVGLEISAIAKSDGSPADIIQVLALDFRLPTNSEYAPVI